MGSLKTLRFTALFPFCGIAGGALGFQRATAALERLGIEARFDVLGGIDFDAGACEAFTHFTGAPCLCAGTHTAMVYLHRAPEDAATVGRGGDA